MKLNYHSYITALVLALFGALGAHNARADTVAITSPGGLTTNVNPNDPVNLGLVFTANSNFSVDALGIYDESGLTGSEQVGLYNSSGTLLASATVSLSDPVVDGYLFQSITAVALTAGQTYTVVANVGNNPWAYGPAPTTTGVTFTGADYLYGSSLALPTMASGVPAYYGPSFEIAATDPVPEPSNFGFLVTAALLAVFVSKRKQRQTAGC